MELRKNKRLHRVLRKKIHKMESSVGSLHRFLTPIRESEEIQKITTQIPLRLFLSQNRNWKKKPRGYLTRCSFSHWTQIRYRIALQVNMKLGIFQNMRHICFIYEAGIHEKYKSNIIPRDSWSGNTWIRSAFKRKATKYYPTTDSRRKFVKEKEKYNIENAVEIKKSIFRAVRNRLKNSQKKKNK